MLVDGRAALWALSKRLLVAEINGLPLSFAGTLAEVELGQVVGVEADHGCKRAPHLAAETLKRADNTLGQQLLNLFGLILAAGDDLP